jgi:D-alanyl-D-alanine carboxypeptidase/D-alanyl-D-alanine-endopeptidase (penicillin-binding protein 4)
VRWRLVVTLVVTITVLGAAAFIAVDRNSSSPQAPTTAASAEPARSPVLAALGATTRLPTKATVRQGLAASLRTMPAGEQVSGAVVDVTTGTTLWSRQARVGVAPASTLKVLTAAAALRALGPDFRFTTSVRLLGDTIYLVGGGDPTLAQSSSASAIPVRYPAPATLADLAKQTAAAIQPPAQRFKIRVDTSMWSTPALATGWNDGYVAEGDITPPSALELNGGRLRPAEFDSPRTDDPATQAGEAFADLLRQDGVTIRGAVRDATAPDTASVEGRVASPPLSSLVQRMLTDSDNDLAEALGREVAIHHGLPATFEGEVAAITSELAPFGVTADELSLQDASGLSHDDEVAPAALVAVLRAAGGRADGVLGPLIEGLPVAGFTGTLADRYRGRQAGAGTGYVRAKTGSLVGVNALAGVVVDRAGRLLAFALLGYGTFETEAVQISLDGAASALAQLD